MESKNVRIRIMSPEHVESELRDSVPATSRNASVTETLASSLTYCPSCFFFQAEDGIRDLTVRVQTCALPICPTSRQSDAAVLGAYLPSSSERCSALPS